MIPSLFPASLLPMSTGPKKLAVRLVAGCALFVALAVWVLGGPTEAWATWTLDGAGVIAIAPTGMSTCYPPKFSQVGFVGVKPGDSADSVRSRLGEPLAILWSFDDRRFVWFEPRDGGWVTSYAHDLDVPKGTSMAAVRGRWPSHASESWEFSRSCAPDSSRRMRSVSFENGRVTGRHAGVWYD
jgi:hypothetical protein